MRFYLAGSYGRREELSRYAKKIEEVGHLVTSRWLDKENVPYENPITFFPKSAEQDIEDIHDAQFLILFTEDRRGKMRSGGKDVDMGVALALHKQIILVGPRLNVFHYLPGITRFRRWEDAWEQLFEKWEALDAANKSDRWEVVHR